MARYIMQELVDLNKEGKTRLQPKVVIEGCCTVDDMIKGSEMQLSMKGAEVKSSLYYIVGQMVRRLAEGYSVKIEGLGVFTPSLGIVGGRESVDEDGRTRNASSIRVSGVSFRVDKECVRAIGNRMSLVKERGKRVIARSQYSEEERYVLLTQYLERYGVINVSAYASLTGLGRDKAREELLAWSASRERRVTRRGRSPHVVYLLERQVEGGGDGA